MGRRAVLAIALLVGLGTVSTVPNRLSAQAIEFESGGLYYQTMTKGGFTVMFAILPVQIKEFVVLQVAASNGSKTSWTIKPEDFRFERGAGEVVAATPASKVVKGFLDRAGHNEVIKLVGTYEIGLYGLSRFQSTNGYEQRRQQFLAEVSNSKIKAAAAASAIAFVSTRLKSGESTDGAIFFDTRGKPLGAGKLVATVGPERFEFEVGGLRHPTELKSRPPQ
jgi:hypothetical protein